MYQTDVIPKKVKNQILLNELFPDFTSEKQLRLINKWDKRIKKADKEKLESIILPNKQEIILPDDFDMVELMDAALDPVTGAVRNLKIDDRDLPQAKNYYDFAYRIIGKDANPPWARQMWTGLMLFGEVCTACTKPKYMQVDSLAKSFDSEFITDKMTILKHGVCPKCKRNKWDLIKNHNLRDYQQLVNVLGQRSGKSSSAASYCAYIAHSYLKFPDLGSLARSEMQSSTQLTGTFVSLTTGKAIGLLWTPFKKLMEASSWFQEYNKMLDYHKVKLGKELYRDSTIYVEYFHKNLRFYPSGPRSTTLRGDTRIFGVLDELGLFPLPTGDAEEDEQSERANADEAHKSLSRSLTTVQTIRRRLMREGISAVPPAVLLNVSSPISQRDKMMRLLRQSLTEEGCKYLLGVNLATWEVNPSMEKDDPVIALAYLENYEKAERDYGANPPSVHSQFIPKTAIEPAFINGQNSHRFKYMMERPGEIYGRIERIRSVKFPSVVTIDAGHVNNSFTITAEHFDFDTQKTVGSTILECMPLEGRTINFNEIYLNIILPLCKDVNAVALIADRWQGIDLLYRIEKDMGTNPKGKVRCKAKQFSLRRKHFNSYIAMLNSKSIIYPTVQPDEAKHIFDGNVADYRAEMIDKPVQHLMLQMYTIQDVGVSLCPTKGDGYTDDILRASVLGTVLIHEPKMMERLKEALDFNYGQGAGNRMPMPAFAGRSGGFGRRSF